MEEGIKKEENIMKDKRCFIVTPIGPDNSEIRRKAEGVINSVVEPVLRNLNYNDIKAAHHINVSGSINNQVMQRILNDDLVIANLTGLNPNVMYELAVRHATKKPVIHICEKGTNLPFDIVDQRTIFYTNDMQGVEDLKSALERMIVDSLDEDNFEDNPIYNAQRNIMLKEELEKKQELNVEGELLKRLDKMERMLINKECNTIKENYETTKNKVTKAVMVNLSKNEIEDIAALEDKTYEQKKSEIISNLVAIFGSFTNYSITEDILHLTIRIGLQSKFYSHSLSEMGILISEELKLKEITISKLY